MSPNRTWPGVAACLLLAIATQGCADVVVFGREVHKASPASTPPAAVAAPTSGRETVARVAPIGRVSLEIDARAASKIEANPAFNRDALLDAIHEALRSRALMAADGAGATATVSIVDFETHATSNAIVFGYRPGAGSLSAVMRVADAGVGQGAPLDIAANALLRAPAGGGGSSFPLVPLYRDLASRVADALAGTPGRTDDSARSAIPH